MSDSIGERMLRHTNVNLANVQCVCEPFIVTAQLYQLIRIELYLLLSMIP